MGVTGRKGEKTEEMVENTAWQNLVGVRGMMTNLCNDINEVVEQLDGNRFVSEGSGMAFHSAREMCERLGQYINDSQLITRQISLAKLLVSRDNDCSPISKRKGRAGWADYSRPLPSR